MLDTEMKLLLDRIESLSTRLQRAEDMAQRNMENGGKMMRAQMELSTLRIEMKKTEDKIGEWFEYANKLRAMISPRRKGELPRQPKPIDTDIPF